VNFFSVAFAAAAFASPSPSPAQPATPLPVASPSPAPVPSPSPSATPLPLPTPLVLPADAPPQILAIQTSSNVVHGGDTFTGTVITSTNVAAVEIRMAGRAKRLLRADSGIWQLSYVVPSVPFWMHKTYTADVVAINTAGTEVTQSISISLR